MEVAGTVRKIDDKSRVAGIAFRAYVRFTFAKATLLAAGTTYYLFLAIFALIALAFGITALIGSEALSQAVTEALNKAFPGLIGEAGINTAQLRSIGSATSIVGFLVLLYSGGGAMEAANSSIHQIYGAPKDSRNFLVSKVRLIGWMLMIAPLILASFAPSILVTNFAQPIVEAVGLPTSLLVLISLIVSLALNYLIVWLLLGHMGGIQPERTPRMVGSAIGAVGVELLKYLMASIVAFSVAKPQYGAFAAPIAVLFVLYLLTVVLYSSAAITGGIAEKDEPLPEVPDEQPPSGD